MKVATLNLGSSTVKLSLAEVTDGDVEVTLRHSAVLQSCGGKDEDLAEALRAALEDAGIAPGAVDAVGHRIVHGGTRFVEPARIDAELEEAVEALSRFAPLHNPAALAGVRAARDHFPDRPMVALFDTAFHADRPEASMHYGLPRELADSLGLLRFGFHGIAHAALAEAVAGDEGVDVSEVDAVTLQLGAGCSACAVRGGRSVETSMGATPLEGLVMPGRSGDVGPGALLRLMRMMEDADELEELLSCESGLRGLGGVSDVRILLRREHAGDRDAALALAVFVRRIVQTVGAYLTLLEGDGGVVFGGGIGSNSTEIRSRVAAGLGAWDVELDDARNADPGRGRVSRPGTRPVYAFPADEERILARETARVISGEGSPAPAPGPAGVGSRTP